MEFDTPTRLQKRIQEAVADFSEDVSLPGLARRAPSAASESFTSLEQSTSTNHSVELDPNQHQHQQNRNRQSNGLPSFTINNRDRIRDVGNRDGGVGVGVGMDSTNRIKSSLDISYDEDDHTKRNGNRNLPSLKSALENQRGRGVGGRGGSSSATAATSSTNTQTTAIRIRNPSNSNSISKSQRLALSKSNPLDRSTDTNSDFSRSINALNPPNNATNTNNGSISIPHSSTPQANNITKSIIDGIGDSGKGRNGSGASNYSERIRESLARKPPSKMDGNGTSSNNGRLGEKSTFKPRPSNLTNRTGSSNNDSWKTGNEGARSNNGTGKFGKTFDDDDHNDRDQDEFKSTRISKRSSRDHIEEEREDQQRSNNQDAHPDPSTTSSFISNSFEKRPENERRKSEISNLGSEHESRSGTTSTRTMHTSDIAPSFDVRNARHPGLTSDDYDRIGIDELVPRHQNQNGLTRRSSENGNGLGVVSMTYDDDEEEERQDDNGLTQDRDQQEEVENLVQDSNVDDEHHQEMNQRSETNDTYTRDLSVTPLINQNLNNGGRRNFGVRISPGIGNQRNGGRISPTPSPENTNRSSSVIGMTTSTKTPKGPRIDGDKMKEHLLSTLKYTNSIVQNRRFRDRIEGSIGRTPRIRNKFNLESNDTNSFGEEGVSPSVGVGVSTSPLRARIKMLARENQSTTPRNSRIRNLVQEDVGDGISYASSDSSNDLTIPAKMKGIRRGNTSLPGGIGAASTTPMHNQFMGPSLANVDPIRMGTYQNQIHKQLESRLEESLQINREQNDRIKNLENDWNKALREIELLKKSSSGRNSKIDHDEVSNDSTSSENVKKAGGIGEETYQEIEFDLKSKDDRIEELETELKEFKETNLELEKEADDLYNEAQEIKQERDDLLNKLKEGEELRERNALTNSRSRLSKSKSSNQNPHSDQENESSNSKEELEKELTELSEAYDELYSKYENLNQSHEEGVLRLKEEVEKEFKTLEERLTSEIKLGENKILSLKEDLQISERKVERLQEEREALIDSKGDDSKIFGLNDQISQLENENNHLNQELRRAKSDLEVLEHDLKEANSDLDAYEVDFQDLKTELHSKVLQLQQTEDELEEIKEERDSLLENANIKYKHLEKESNNLLNISREKKEQLEKEIKELKEELIHLEDRLGTSKSPILSSSKNLGRHSKSAPNSSLSISKEESALEKKLDEAYQEIGKLKHQIQLSIEKKVNGTIPMNDESEKEKEVEINQLRFEVEMLNHKLNGLRDQHLSYSNVGNDSQATPKKNHYQHKNVRDLKNSPFKAPMSSSGILNEISWLNQDSLAENSVIGKIQILQAQLGFLNADIDMKLDNWPKAKAKEMEEKLSFAEQRISELESELSELRRNRINPQSSRSSRNNSNILSKSSNEQNTAYQKVVNELLELKSNWEDDINRFNDQKMEMERIRNGLQNENDVMSKEVQEQKERERVQKINAKKATELVHQQLERARRVTKAFELELREGRSYLESLDMKSREALQSRSEIQARLAKTESEFSQIQASLVEKQRRYDQLNAKLLECSRGAGEVHIELSKLSNEISETKLQIEVLKTTKTKILNEKIELNKDYHRTQIESQNRYEELKIAKEAMYAHQEQLDDQVRSIENLHQVLDERNKDLEKISDEKDKLNQERKVILKEVQSLHDALVKLKRDGGEISEEMLQLRDERNMWREKENATSRMVQELRKQAVRLESEMTNHQCLGDATALMEKHASECKGLMLQIRYLKTKFMRESDLRSDLSHQKSYLLQLVGGLELSESATAQFIADIGISRGTIVPDQTPIKKFKKVAIVVRGLVRMKLMAQTWRITLETRNAIREVHQANVKLRGSK